MLRTALRVISAIVAGVVVAIVLLIAVEFFSSIVHPIPADFDGSMEQMCAHVANYPQWVLAVCVPMWGLTAYLSTWIVQRIGGIAPALVMGLLLIAAVAFNVSQLPYPMWFKIVSLLVVPAAVALGSRQPILSETAQM